jgi:hypothetical protein
MQKVEKKQQNKVKKKATLYQPNNQRVGLRCAPHVMLMKLAYRGASGTYHVKMNYILQI